VGTDLGFAGRVENVALNKKRDTSVAAGMHVPAEGVLERVLDANAQNADGAEAQSGSQVLTGHLAGLDGEGRILFLPDGSAQAPIAVTIGTPEPDGVLIKAARVQRRALVTVVENGRPVLVGLLRDRVEQHASDTSTGDLAVFADGETVNIQANRQIELRCGKASLLLRADGRVILSGTYVVSTSRGPNKIRGATVTLN